MTRIRWHRRNGDSKSDSDDAIATTLRRRNGNDITMTARAETMMTMVWQLHGDSKVTAVMVQLLLRQ